MKMYLCGTLSNHEKPEKEEVTLIKTNSMCTVITSKSLKFLDIVGGAALQEASILVDFRILSCQLVHVMYIC